MSECLDLVSFAEGELEPERAEAFRAHLPTCEACQAGHVDAMQLSAHLSTLAPLHGRPTAPVPPTPPAYSRMRLALWAAAVTGPAAIALYVLIPPQSPPALV